MQPSSLQEEAEKTGINQNLVLSIMKKHICPLTLPLHNPNPLPIFTSPLSSTTPPFPIPPPLPCSSISNNDPSLRLSLATTTLLSIATDANIGLL